MSFLGVVNYLALHLPHNSTIIAPLTELTGKAPWRWDDLHQTAFDQVKRLCDFRVPITPTDYRQIKEGKTKVFLITDVSKVGCGAIIYHGADLADARTNVAAMFSRRFTTTVKPGRFTGGDRTQAVTSSNSTQRIVTCVVAVTL